MWKEALLAYASQLPLTGTSNVMSHQKLPSELAIYSVKSNDESTQTIFALRNAYVDAIVDEGHVAEGVKIFQLNSFEIDRESLKLEQELALSELSGLRLEKNYVDKLIIRPLQAALGLAESEENAAVELLGIALDKRRIYQDVDVYRPRIELHQRKINVRKIENDLRQRNIEIEAQIRRFNAEQSDLKNRIEFNKKILEVSSFNMPFEGIVEMHTYVGAFLEEGDPICTIHRT